MRRGKHIPGMKLLVYLVLKGTTLYRKMRAVYTNKYRYETVHIFSDRVLQIHLLRLKLPLCLVQAERKREIQ